MWFVFLQVVPGIMPDKSSGATTMTCGGGVYIICLGFGKSLVLSHFQGNLIKLNLLTMSEKLFRLVVEDLVG